MKIIFYLDSISSHTIKYEYRIKTYKVSNTLLIYPFEIKMLKKILEDGFPITGGRNQKGGREHQESSKGKS